MATSKVPRVYLDSCYYIDVAKGEHGISDPNIQAHLPFVQALFLAAQNGDIEIWASTFVITECLSVDKTVTTMNVPQNVQETFLRLLKAGDPVKLQAVDVFIAERARDLRWTHEINCGGGADAIHVATAIELGCEEFISTNKKRGPLNQTAATKLSAQFRLRVIEAPFTSVLPPALSPGPLFRGTR